MQQHPLHHGSTSLIGGTWGDIKVRNKKVFDSVAIPLPTGCLLVIQMSLQRFNVHITVWSIDGKNHAFKDIQVCGQWTNDQVRPKPQLVMLNLCRSETSQNGLGLGNPFGFYFFFLWFLFFAIERTYINVLVSNIYVYILMFFFLFELTNSTSLVNFPSHLHKSYIYEENTDSYSVTVVSQFTPRWCLTGQASMDWPTILILMSSDLVQHAWTRAHTAEMHKTI